MMGLHIASFIDRLGLTLDKLNSSLVDLNPRGVLKRGYALVYDELGSVVTSAYGSEQNMDIEFSDGKVSVTRKD